MILSTKQELKILIFFSISKIKTTLKTIFSGWPFIFFYFDFIKNESVSKDKKFFFYKKIEIPAIFWYLIGCYYTWKDFIISVKRILIISKDVILSSKSSTIDKKFIIEREWFSVLLLSIK